MESHVKAKVNSMFRDIDLSNWSNLSLYFHPQVEYFRPGYQLIRGIDELLEFYRNNRVILSGKHVVEEIFYSEQKSTLIVKGSFDGLDKEGRKLAARFCDFHYYESKKIRTRETLKMIAGITSIDFF